MDTILDKIKEILLNCFDWINKDTEILESSKLKEDLELDNHDIRAIVSELERIYGLDLVTVIGKANTLQDIIEFTQEKMKEMGGEEEEKLLKEITKED